MERRRVLEGSALGTPIDNGQVPWNNKLYQNARRVRSLTLDKSSFGRLRPIQETKIVRVIEAAPLFNDPIVVTQNADINLDPGITRITNGNSEAGLGDDLPNITINGHALGLLMAGQSVTVLMDPNWHSTGLNWMIL